LASGRELEAGSPNDQGDTDLALECGDVFRDRGLAEVKALRCADEGLLTRDRLEGS
jgi:hypothetical protein